MKKLLLVLMVAILLLVACGKKEAEVENQSGLVKELQSEGVSEEVSKVVSMNFTVQGTGLVAKELIQTAAHTVEGVTQANWDLETKVLTVKAETKINWEDVHTAIANAGFDTSEMQASDDAYDLLPEEAKYREEKTERKATVRDNDNGRTKATRQKAE